MYEKLLSTYCILTHIFRYWKRNMTLSTIDWEEKKRNILYKLHYPDIDCHDDNINSNIPTSW